MWDMPITINIAGVATDKSVIDSIFDYFLHVDSLFNIFKENSEISRINRGEVKRNEWSHEMNDVISLCEITKKESSGYFNHKRGDFIDPLGLVKGWAIKKASDMLQKRGCDNYIIDAGGDIEVRGLTFQRKKWTVGIRNPFNRFENIKILNLTDCAVATSGTYIRGNHIYNPLSPNQLLDETISMTVIGPNVYEADRFATAAFAMGKNGIYFIEKMAGLEGYLIDKNGTATYTSGFAKYTQTNGIIDSFIQSSL